VVDQCRYRCSQNDLYIVENILFSVATDTQLLEFAAQGDRLSFIQDVKSSEDAEESKGGGGVGRSSRYVDVLLRAIHIHIAIFGNGEQLSHGWIHMVIPCNI